MAGQEATAIWLNSSEPAQTVFLNRNGYASAQAQATP